MKRLILCLALLTLAASAQVSSGTARRVVKGTSAPAACQVGDIFFDTDATAGSNLFGCTSVNTWTLLGGSSTVTLNDVSNPTAAKTFTFDNAENLIFQGGTATTTVNLFELLSGTANTGTGYLAYFKGLGAQNVLKLEVGTGSTATRLISLVGTAGTEVGSFGIDGTLTAGGSGTVGDLKLNTGACPAGSASTVTHCADTGDIPRVRQGTGTATALSGAIVDASATTASNPSAEASLKSVTLATNILNAADRTINVVSAGGYTTAAAQTPTIRIRGKLCTVSGCGSGTVITLFDFTTPATTASATSMGWSCDVTISTRTSGAAGVVVPGGQCSFNLGTSNTTVTATHTPTVSAVASSAIDLTGTVYYQLTWLNSSSDAGNSAVQNLSVATPLR